MKVLVGSGIAVALCAAIPFGHTAEVLETTSINASVGAAFRADFYQPDGTHVVYSTSVPFTNVDPAETFALSDGRAVNDGKSDIGIYCISGDNTIWHLKIGITGGNIPDNKLKYYLSQPSIWTGSQSVQTNGAINPNPPAWTLIPKGTGATIYRSGSNDTLNTPYGTLATISFQLDTAGLSRGTYSAIVTYTMTTSP